MGKILPTPLSPPKVGRTGLSCFLRVLLKVVLHKKTVKRRMYNIVFLYNYAVNILCIKSGDGYGFYCMLKQAEIDVQSTSNRKLPNFYEKVTDFLWESYRISKWWQNHVFTETFRICHKWRILTYWTMRLFMQTDWLFMQKRIDCLYQDSCSIILYSLFEYV